MKHSADSLIALTAEAYFAFLYWIANVDLAPAVWFVPMDAMGADARVVVALVVPLLCLLAIGAIGFESARALLDRHYILVLTTGAMLTIGSVFAPNIYVRAGVISGGVCLGHLAFVGRLFSSPSQREIIAWALQLGLLLLLISRFAYYSQIVIWESDIHTYFSMGLAIISALALSFSKDSETLDDVLAKQKDARSLGREICFSLGFSAFFYLNVWVLTNSGMFARWLDLDTFPVGIGIISSFALGIMLNLYPAFVRCSLWYYIAVASGYLVCTCENRIAIWFAFVVVAYAVSVAPHVILDFSSNVAPGLLVMLSLLAYQILFPAINIWISAWCFVPFGGQYMRHRISQYFGITLAFVGLGYMKRSRSIRLPEKVVIFVFLLTTLLFVPIVSQRSVNWQNYDNNAPKSPINAAVWAVRFGYDNRGWNNFEAAKDLLVKLNFNVISLVETDMMRFFNGNRDFVEYLENTMNFYTDYGPSSLNDTWGCSLVSAFPIVRADHVVLPSPEGETACLIDATLNATGKLVDIINVHIGNTQHFWDRVQQIDDIVQRVKAKAAVNRPTILLGYLTTHKMSALYNALIRAGLSDSLPDSSTSDRYCLYHLYMNLKASKLQRVQGHGISDTELQHAKYAFWA